MSSEIEIREIPEKIAMVFKKAAGKVIQMREDGKTVYLAAFRGKKILGFVGYMVMDNQIRFKADYVQPSERGKGVYSMLMEKRIEECTRIAKERGIDKFTCFSSKLSRGTFKRFGFEEVRQVRERTAYMEKQIR